MVSINQALMAAIPHATMAAAIPRSRVARSAMGGAAVIAAVIATVPVARMAIPIMAMPIIATAVPGIGIAVIAAVVAPIIAGIGGDVAAGEARQEHGACQEPSRQCQSQDFSPLKSRSI